MVMALIMMIVRLAITCFTLAARLALALAAFFGKLLGHLIAALWRGWRNRKAGKVPLRAPKQIESSVADRQIIPPTPATSTFTPRPMRNIPRR